MAEEEAKKVEPAPEACSDAPPVEAPKEVVADEKLVVPPPAEEKPDDSKALAIVESNFLTLFINVNYSVFSKD